MLDTIRLPRSTVHLLCTREAGPEARHQWTPFRLPGACDPREALEEDKRQEEKDIGARIHQLPLLWGHQHWILLPEVTASDRHFSPSVSARFLSGFLFFPVIILLRRLFKHFSPNPFLSFPIIETVIPQIHCRSVSMCCVCVCVCFINRVRLSP